MPSLREQRGTEYSSWLGLIFIFNLIVGTGALALPAVFAKVGWLLGFAYIIIMAFISYITVTFVIEAMACGNAVCHWRRLQYIKRDRMINTSDRNISMTDNTDYNDDSNMDDMDNMDYENAMSTKHPAELSDSSSVEQTPLFSQSIRYYSLDHRIEMGEMAGLFFNDFGRILFYICIAVYLYGDLSIYSAAVAKTLRDVICVRNESATNMTDDMLEMEPCWMDHTMTRIDCYRLSLISFIMLLGPFTFFDVQKTKYIQMISILFRWIAFIIMITIAVHRLLVNGPQGTPPIANLHGIPALFGACVYSFMCHHSLPSIVAPITNKHNLRHLLSLDYGLIAIFYLCLALTGAFAFAHLEDLYTLNFIPNSIDQTTWLLKIIEYFLTLFPVFTLSASFPIISITLRNNLQTLFLDTSRLDGYNFLVRRLIFPMLVIGPPFLITFYTDDVTKLVKFTGYAGTGIQYIIPLCLVYAARNTCTDLLGQGIVNDFRSPFSHRYWLIFIGMWAITYWTILMVLNTLWSDNNDNNNDDDSLSFGTTTTSTINTFHVPGIF